MFLAQASDWIPIGVLFVYLAVVLYIGIFAFRRGKNTGEDFFMASRSIGTIVFFLSLFATNMTAFAILGSSGMSYKQGIGVFGMMATSSAFVIPLTLIVIGTRLWGHGRRFGHMTQVQFLRDRWECSGIGTFIFLLTAAMMIPYLIISIVGGGQILEGLTQGKIPYAAGAAIVALVVMGNVFFGGMRGAVLVNIFQTILFLAFGLIAVLAIGHDINFGQTVDAMAKNPTMRFAVTRERIPEFAFLSYLFIPLSSIMFPHMSIMCMTARKVTSFKKTVILYPLSIMAIWLPCCFLGAIAVGQPKINGMMAATAEPMKEWLEHPEKTGPEVKFATDLVAQLEKTPKGHELVADARKGGMAPQEFGRRLPEVVGPLAKTDPALYKATVPHVRALSSTNSDSVLLHMLRFHVPAWLAGLLAAGIISAVMGSDCHQILALSTMFTKDIFDYYGGRKKYGDRGTVIVGRTFIVVANLIAYLIALRKPAIFELAISYAFSGFAALAPVMLAALFWKRSTKWGALAAAVWVAASVAGIGLLEHTFAPGHPAFPPRATFIWGQVGTHWILYLNPGGKLMVWGWLPVVPIVLGSAACMIIFSLLTSPPSQQTINRYFSREDEQVGDFPAEPAVAH